MRTVTQVLAGTFPTFLYQFLGSRPRIPQNADGSSVLGRAPTPILRVLVGAGVAEVKSERSDQNE